MTDDQRLSPELKAKWLHALRSRKYKQAHGILRDEKDRMCCLGVLCDVIDPTGWLYESGLWVYHHGDSGNSRYLPVTLRVELGLNRKSSMSRIDMDSELANRNDGHGGHKPQSFRKLADWIEENL